MDAAGLVMTQEVPCGLLLVGPDELIIEANERMATMLGRTPAQLLGQSWLTLVPRGSRLIYHTYMAPLLGQYGHVEEVSLPWVAADGSAVDTLVNARSLVRDGQPMMWLAAFHLRERRQLEEQLLQAKRAAEQVPGLLFLLRRSAHQHWQLLYASEAVRELFGVSPIQAVAAPELIWQTVHPEDAPLVLAAVNDSGEQMKPFRVEFRVSLNGTEQWRETHATPQREPDGSLLWHGYTSDITERKTMEAAKQDRLAAERASQAKSAFLARVSHELRTPLNGILGFSKLMLMDATDPLGADHRRKLGYIEEAGQALLRLINEVMDISRIETGQIVLNMAPLVLWDVVSEAVRMVEPLALQHHAQVLITGSTQPQVHADSHRLTQVLINLLTNAVKYGPEGGLVTVKVMADEENGQACVEVTDQGPGLTPEQQAQLYQPFNRLGAERSGVEGTGLGLIISRGLVELMGGRLKLDSEPGRGCHFVVCLPRVAAADEAIPPVPRITPTQAPKPAPSPAVGAALEVLYVEDNPVNMMLMESVLAHRPDCHLLPATSGAAALEAVKHVKPDILLVDIHLPDTDGVSLLKALRAERADLADVPAIAVSADALTEDIRTALSEGFTAYWTKPLDVAQVLARMDALPRAQGRGKANGAAPT
jgi:PAS domain S-box-containing protein